MNRFLKIILFILGSSTVIAVAVLAIMFWPIVLAALFTPAAMKMVGEGMD